jgi:hypothetical protein
MLEVKSLTVCSHSAAYQVVRVPGPSEIVPIQEEILGDLVNLENQSSGLIVETLTPDVTKCANNVSSAQQTVTVSTFDTLHCFANVCHELYNMCSNKSYFACSSNIFVRLRSNVNEKKIVWKSS